MAIRTRYLAPFAAALLLGMASTAAALERGTQLTVTTPELAERLIATVEDAIWAADGHEASKPVYVVYGTDCSWSEKLFQDARALGGKVQLRWIPAGGANAAAVVAQRDAAAVRQGFSGRMPAPADAAARRGADYNNGIPSSLAFQLQAHDATGRIVYPTLVYRTAGGVKVVSGNPARLASLPDEVVAQPGGAQPRPAALDWSAAPPAVSPSRNLSKWGPAEGTAIFRMAPAEGAAPVFDLAAGRVMDVTGIVAEGGWIQTRIGPAAVYARDPLAARMALLDFQVSPASGFVEVRRPGGIQEFPHRDARVVATASTDKRYRRTGTVEFDGRVWDRIALFTDGTPGYLAR